MASRKIVHDVADVWSRVIPTEGCWVWTGSLSSDGYGLMSFNGHARWAHRLMYEYERGPIPTGMQIDHLCRNRSCVNPWHMEVVTPRVNTLRGVGVTARLALSTHCPNGHEYTRDNTRITVLNGREYRRCITCLHDRQREGYYRWRNVMNPRRNEARKRARAVARLLEPRSDTPEAVPPGDSARGMEGEVK